MMAERGSCNRMPVFGAGSEQEGVVRFCPKRHRAGPPPGVHLSERSLLLTAGNYTHAPGGAATVS
jgi:hypothetical protein